MPRTKISEFSATPANNTDIDSINIAEGCAPSGINDAIRELMAQLKDFQTGAVGDSFNGPIGATTASTGAFTTLSASSTLGVTGVSTLTGGAVVQGLTVGKGTGAVATNTAVGAGALQGSNSGNGNNVAVGYEAGRNNTTGAYNTWVGGLDYNGGLAVGRNNTQGQYNCGFGAGALAQNTTASYSTAIGYQSGYAAVTADYNTFLGYRAGYSTTGDQNTFLGKFAGNAITSGATNTIVGAYNGNQGGLDIRTASNYTVISDGGGTPHLAAYAGGTVALQGAIPNAGTGITFPATQSASSNANTLDDYEEGSFTATLTCTTSGTITLSYNTLYYTKIGRQVTITGYLEVSSVSSPVGYVRLNGLPFTVANLSIQRVPLNIAADGLNATAVTALTGVLEENQTRGQLNKFSAGTVSPLAGDVKAGVWFAVGATYFTS